MSLEVHKLLAIPIAFLLVFRSNVAHQRFWEGICPLVTISIDCSGVAGRAHMGELFATMRSVLRKSTVSWLRVFGWRSERMLQTLIIGDDDDAHALRCNICRLLPVLAIAIKNDLRHRTKSNSAADDALNACCRSV